MSTDNELRLGKFGNQGSVNTDSLKGGVKREAAEKAGFGNIFDAFDDGNGVLTDNEINTLKQGITESAKHGKDSIFSENEAEEYIKNFNQNAQANNKNNLENIDSKELFDFVKFIEQQSKSVISSTVDSNNNAVIKYKNESGQEVTEIINKDTKVTEQVIVANGKEIRTFLKDNKKEKVVETEQSTGKVTTTLYDTDGETIKSTVVEEKSGKKTVTEYQKADGEQESKPVKVTISNGNNIEEQTLVNGELKTTHKIVNKGQSNQKDISIEYTKDGRVETIRENGETYTVEYDKSGKTTTKRNGTTTVVTVADGKKTEVVTKDNSKDITTNVYNMADKKLSQTKVVNGKEYRVTYDGNGNTTGIVVQYGENAEKIAKKFGISKEALLKANGKNENEDFNVGDVIIIPKELEADDKNVKGRKSSADAIKDKQRADERARQREIARQRAIALDKQYRAAGLKNYTHKGEKFKYGNETYTVIGTMNTRARLMVKDSKGNILIASHDHFILKDSYVKLTNAYDKGQKVTMRNGKKVVVLNSRGDKHGRMIGIDEHGRQVVISGGKSKTDLSDRVVLNNSYVEASDVRDVVMTRINTAKNDNERQAVISQNRSFSNENIIRCKGKNGQVWYFDIKTGKAVNLTKQEAAAITKELDDASDGWFFGLGTDESQLSKANNAIVDPAVLAEINKYYESKGYQAGEYKSAYEAFLASEISDSEIYEANAALVDNNAILDQARRDEILLTNLTTYGSESANRNKALKAIGTRTDYDNLQSNLARYNRANGYNPHFKGQDALQTTLYNITNGNVIEIDSANRALIDSEEDFLTHDEIIRILAEVGAMYLEKGDSKNATRSQNAEVLAAMDNLTTSDGQEIDVKSKANKVDLMIAGYGDFSDEEMAQEVIKYLRLADKYIDEVNNDMGSTICGEGHEFDKIYMASDDHQAFEDYATIAHQLIKNYNILAIVKKEMGKEYSRIVSRIEFETSEREDLFDANSKKEPKINFSNMLLANNALTDLSSEEYEQNMQLLDPIRAAVYSLEAQHLDAVDGEGWKLDFVNELRQHMFLGTTRADVANQYAMSKATLNKLELAAKGLLVDSNGNKISFEDAVEQLTGKTVQDLQALNQEYIEHQAYGEMGVDLTVGLVTMVLPIPGLGVGKLVSVGSKVYKVAKVVNAAKNEYKLVEVAISSLQTGLKMKTVQYTMDRTNIASSVSGDTLEARGAVEDKSDEVALYSSAGVAVGGTTSILSSRLSSTLGRATVNGLGFGADLAFSAAISQQFHGGSFSDYLTLTNEDGSLNTSNILNNVMTVAGYLHVSKGVKHNTVHSPEINHVKQEVTTPKLDAISKDAKPRSVYIKTKEKFAAIKEEVDAKLKTITTEAELDALKKQVDVIQNRDMRRKLEGMIESKRAEVKGGGNGHEGGSREVTGGNDGYVALEANPVGRSQRLDDLAKDPTIDSSLGAKLADLNERLSGIHDSKVKKYIEDMFSDTKDIYTKITDAEAIVDGINNIEGNYSTLNGTYYGHYNKKGDWVPYELEEHAALAKYIRSQGTSLENIMKGGPLPESMRESVSREVLLADLETDVKFRRMDEYIKKNPKSKLSNYMYENYYLKYLKQMGVDPKYIKKCREINKKYNVKIKLSKDLSNADDALKLVEEEMRRWHVASGGTAKLPPVFEFSSANSWWYDTSVAYGKSAASAYSQSGYNGAQAYSKFTRSNIEWAMRHETTHTNDLKQGINIDPKYDLDKIFPGHYEMINGTNVKVNEPEKCPYYDELRRAGLSHERIDYACNNTQEFIAVASEGDLSSYSPEFRQVLIDFGMPEWLFKLDMVIIH